MVQILFKFFFVIGIALFFVQCQDDPAREAARQAALESAAQPTAPAPPPSNERVRPATTGTLTLSAEGNSVSSGDEVCLAVTAQDFQKIVSMQYSMTWDSKVLKFKGVKSFGLAGLGVNNFGTQATSTGVLTFSWFDANVQGITHPDGNKLYDICFEAIGETGSQTKFQFADTPVIVEITNSNSQFFDLNGQPAVVKVR